MNYVGFLPLQSFNSTGLTTSFKAINASGFTEPVSYAHIVNDSNKDIEISFDGINSHVWIAAGEPWERTFQDSAQPKGNLKLVREGTIVYVKSTGSGSGYIYLESSY